MANYADDTAIFSPENYEPVETIHFLQTHLNLSDEWLLVNQYWRINECIQLTPL